MNPSSLAAPSLWSQTRWSSYPPPAPLPPRSCPCCSRSSRSPKGRAWIHSPYPPPAPTSKAVRPTTRSQRVCCSWPRAGAKRPRRRRRRRRKEGVLRQQVQSGGRGSNYSLSDSPWTEGSSPKDDVWSLLVAVRRIRKWIMFLTDIRRNKMLNLSTFCPVAICVWVFLILFLENEEPKPSSIKSTVDKNVSGHL